MKKAYLIIVTALLLLSIGCTKDNFISTGNSKGRFDGSTLEYLEAHHYDWDSTAIMIRHAGEDMVKLFEGKDEKHPEITFFGMTNHSIRRYLLQNDIKQVRDLDAEWCKSILLQHVVDGKHFRTDFPIGEPGDFGSIGTGGITFPTLGGTELWVRTWVDEKGGIVENGARPIFVYFKKVTREFDISSGDMEQDNGVVHALEYWFTLGQEEK